MATNISANQLLNNYTLFNATDIKQFIIDQLRANPESPFKDVEYLGSNINALIDVIAVMLQQIQFSYSLNTSEASFSNAALYESMSKIVSILNYKSIGKQTSMLPVRINVNTLLGNNPIAIDNGEIILPKFLTLHYNKQYVLLNEETVYINSDNGSIDTILYQGSVHESQVYIATGDEFEIIHLPDNHIDNTSSFISDNFFTVYVQEPNSSVWKEYKETACLFLENSSAEKYEKRFTEDFSYEFKFGNGTYGKRLKAGTKIIIYYLISDGEDGQLLTSYLQPNLISEYSSANYQDIRVYQYTSNNGAELSWLSAQNTGPSTAISYPESIASIRKNAPKVFASQNRLYSLNDYEVFIMKNFSNYCKHIYMCKNDDYVSNYLKYYYDLGFDAPQTDSRVALSQVDFMTANHFNNIYCFVVPMTNTLIDGKVPNYLNSSLKRMIVNKCTSLMGPTHNLVIADPIHKAFCFGSYNITDTRYNGYQLQNKLFVIRKKNASLDISYIKNYVVAALRTYFKSLKLGSPISCTDINSILNSVPETSGFYIQDILGNKISEVCFYVWNPLYQYEDNRIITQNYIAKEFEYPYFYDLDNLESMVNVIDA